MSSPRPPDCLAGDEALARGAWAEAREAFEAALRVRDVPEALEGLGLAAWWLDLAGDPDRAHALAAEGIRIAREVGNTNLEMLGRAADRTWDPPSGGFRRVTWDPPSGGCMVDWFGASNYAKR